jgi:hypothetical protein
MLIEATLSVVLSLPHRSVRTAVPSTLGDLRMRGTWMRYRPICADQEEAE